jgi:hypothetical protein
MVVTTSNETASGAGFIYVSSTNNSNVTTWVKVPISQVWSVVKISNNGQRMFAASSYGYYYPPTASNEDPTFTTGKLYASSDYGISWAPRSGLSGGVFTALAISSDGQKMIIGSSGFSYGYGSPIISVLKGSIDYGNTWSFYTTNVNSGTQIFIKLAMSNDRNIIAYISLPNSSSGNGAIYVSSNGGSSWRAGSDIYLNTLYKKWTDVDMSDDGSVMVATATAPTSTVNSEYIYISKIDIDVPNSQGKFWNRINELEVLPGQRFWSGIALARTPAEPNEYIIAATASSDTIYIREPCDP